MVEDFDKMASNGGLPSRSREPQIKYLEKEEVYKFFMSITGKNYRDKALFDLIYRHGLRRIEATWLKKDWVHNGRIWVQRAKNGISQEYNLHPASAKLLELYLAQRGEDANAYLFISRESRDARPISSGLIYHLFQKYAARAGIVPEKRFVHILRHSISVHLLNAGWDISDVQDWLGHRDIRNTAIYGKVSNKRREMQFKKLLKSNEIANTLPGV
ncbi:MAG: tyrosine-type recombinase/integrase [Ktedonobacteraceae bacterium]